MSAPKERSVIGQVIEDALQRLGKSQVWLAGEMGVSRNAVSKWIGNGTVNRKKFPRLADLLAIPVQVLADPWVIQSGRVKRLAELVDRQGGTAAFVRGLSCELVGGAPTASYISQLLTGHSSFGEKAARKLAIQAGLPQDFFDRDGIALEGGVSLRDRFAVCALQGLLAGPKNDLESFVERAEFAYAQADAMLAERSK